MSAIDLNSGVPARRPNRTAPIAAIPNTARNPEWRRSIPRAQTKPPYADIEVRGHRETWRVRSSGFRDWLVALYYRRTGEAPNTTAIEQALRNAEAGAKYNGSGARFTFASVATMAASISIWPIRIGVP